MNEDCLINSDQSRFRELDTTVTCLLDRDVGKVPSREGGSRGNSRGPGLKKGLQNVLLMQKKRNFYRFLHLIQS